MKHNLFYLFIAFSLGCQAQESLTFMDAISIGLKNNYNIQLAKTDSILNANDATLGNAGFLPTLTLNGNATKSSSDIKQKFSTGLELNRDGVGASNIGSNLALNWTLFDGFKMFATLDELKEIKSQGEIKVRQEMENTVANIITAYFTIAKQKQQLNAIKELMYFYEERIKIAETRLEIGNGNKTDVLQAKVDLNEQKSAFLKQKTAIENSKIALNEILGRDSRIDFNPIDTAIKVGELNGDKLQKNMQLNNKSLMLANSDIKTAALAFKEIQAQRFPKISLLANYNFTRNTSDAGFALLNQNAGLSYGINFSWNIFDGFSINRNLEDAKTAEFAAKIRYEILNQKQMTLLNQAFNKYKEAQELMILEQESVTLSAENVAIMIERFKLAQSTTLELKEAQNSLLNAKTRLINAQFDAKIAETELKRLDGTLLER